MNSRLLLRVAWRYHAPFIYMSTIGRGGAGGFGGFPYRSAHPQGTVGGRGGAKRRRAKMATNQDRAASFAYCADIRIPADRRVRLIGRGGVIIKELMASTGVNIHVPKHEANFRGNVDDRPVHVKAATIANLLHACWRIAQLGLVGEEVAACNAHLPNLPHRLRGNLGRESPFFNLDYGMAAFCIETTAILPEQVDTLVDNERFAHSEVTATCETILCDSVGVATTALVFIYGSPAEYPEQLCQSLLRSIFSTKN